VSTFTHHSLAELFSLNLDDSPFLIAGPCGAESEEQIYDTAAALFSQGVRVFRAGVWKPRTRPAAFAGAGDTALRWLNRLQTEFGMKVIVEVASAQHVEAALAAKVDAVWIGARTTVNTFAVQEIAEALRGAGIPVLVKNPVHPEIELWLGAIERLRSANTTKIAAVHRGFSGTSRSIYRNDPRWQLAIDFRLREPTIPILCDPSHMAGRKELLQELSQRAVDLNYDGLMVEVHCSPETALSDADQQLSPQDFAKMISSLIVRKEEHNDDRFQRELGHLRGDIDRLDDEILHLISQRMEISERIGFLKRDLGVTILQSSRWDKLLARVVSQGVTLGMSEKFVQDIYKAIHEESINRQTRIMNSHLSSR
jgi:chorismate mutase